MSDFIGYLRKRIEATQRELQAANERMQQAMADRETLGADLQGYERALSAEMRNEGMAVPDVAMAQVSPSDDNGDTPEVNKAEFARQFIRARAETGATPTDIMKGFQEAGIPIKKPYIYALVQRIQKQGAIKSKRGKWFPVPLSERPTNGTAEKALP